MIKSTKNYDMFILRNDNRERISQNHVNRLKQSIESRNLLSLRPICVNGEYEVIDGQHRLLAAKALGVEIYYEVQSTLNAKDIVPLNTSKAWGMGDYLNYYVKNEYPEYKKFAEWMKRKNITIKVGLAIAVGASEAGRKQFQHGEFIFKSEDLELEFDICWDTIELIRRLNGYTPYAQSARFWKALLQLVTHSNFQKERLFSNLSKMNDKICAKASMQDYLKLFMEIHNWRNQHHVNLIEADV